jgi:acyl-CoA reductase-like NAD-dependent aldehyde dehydrogenase
VIALPVLRWGAVYESLEADELRHFLTGEPVARVSQANGGLVQKDMRKASQAREVLRAIPPADLIRATQKAADLYLKGNLPLGDGRQSAEDFARQQSATTGLPEHMCRGNMEKNHFVLTHMAEILDALTRGLDPEILARGWGKEHRGVVVSYQAQTPVLGLVLPSNSPGVHTLWLPVIPMQIGLVLKPGPQEPWTPYRMAAAFAEAGIPPEAISIYPGGPDVGQAVVSKAPRSLIFGSTQTVNMYKGNPAIQVHGPGFSKILLGDDVVDDWESYLDLMVDSIYKNSGRGCINCSGVWASRHTKEIAAALAERLGPIEALPPDHPEAGLAAFTVDGQADAVWSMIEADVRENGVTHATESYGPRLVKEERCAYIRPTILHCASPEVGAAGKEYMFPFATVVECPQEKMIGAIGSTLVCTGITGDEKFRRELSDATNIDRLNLGPIPTIRLDWMQPHEGNIVEFLFRARSYQVEPLGVKSPAVTP